MTWRGRSNPVEYQGERVVTLAQMDGCFEQKSGTARKRFGRNRQWLEEGSHFHRMASGSAGQSVSPVRTAKGGGSDLVVVLTERGFLWLATTFRGPLAARVRLDDRNVRRKRLERVGLLAPVPTLDEGPAKDLEAGEGARRGGAWLRARLVSGRRCYFSESSR
jgi:hypothetical protein